jgi:2-polyprenyl-3-methyl-5-hydroxy-6-metoxy-1,4-benzoquinol methylase
MQEHWQHLYATRAPDQVGWYEPDPAVSRRLVMAAVAAGARSVIDIGGGAPSLVDQLLREGVERVAVVDIAEAGLDIARARLGPRAAAVRWVVGDVTTLGDVGLFDVWHDRAVFHFLLDPDQRRRYVALSERTVPPHGTAVMATFASDGPERCSGLEVRRYEPRDVARECGPGWRLAASERHIHTTPRGIEQRFVYSTFTRVSSEGWR